MGIETSKYCKYCEKVVGRQEKAKKIAVFDLETTGLSHETDRPIEVSAMLVDAQTFEVEDHIDIYINPGFQLPKVIPEITGITDEFLEDKPCEAVVFPEIKEFFERADVVAGYNIETFDIRFMERLYKEYGEKWPNYPSIDVFKMAKELHTPSEAGNLKQGTLLKHFHLDEGLRFHNAQDDAIGCMRLYQHFKKEYLEGKDNLKRLARRQYTGTEKATLLNCWPFEFSHKIAGTQKNMREFRLYMKVKPDDRVVYINQRSPYNWGEKTPGSLDLLDLEDLEQQVLRLYCCENLEELSKIRYSAYSNAYRK